MKYTLRHSYYACFCGGTFYCDMKTIYGIAPALYRYFCDRCGKTKVMACEAEVKELSRKETQKPVNN